MINYLLHPIILGLIAGSRETHQRCDRAEADPGSLFKRSRGPLYCTAFQNVVETTDPEPAIAIRLQEQTMLVRCIRSSKKVMGQFVISHRLKAMGWLATSVMLCVCIGVFVTRK